MSALPVISSLSSMLEAYLRAGFALVPISQGKGPTAAGWNRRENCVTRAEQLNPAVGYGLAHAYCMPVTCALDIDSWGDAVTVLQSHNVDLLSLVHASDSVMIDSGNPGHAKLLFTLPFGITLPTKRVNQNNRTVFELRCASNNGLTMQDLLPSAAIHPTTHQNYKWAGNGHFSKIPTIPQALLDLWQSLLAVPEPIASMAPATITPIDWSEIESAIEAIDPDCSREDWITVGMALQYAGHQSDDITRASMLWNSWSAKGQKYPGPAALSTQWRSFRSEHANAVKLGSLFKLARDAGWSKPMVNAASLFSPLDKVMSPEDLITDLAVPPPAPPMDLMPAVLRRRAEEISEHIGCDPLVPLMAGMAAVCGALDARTRLELMPGFKVPPILWIMSIGEPGDKKTPGSSPMFDVLTQLEREDVPRFAKAATEFEVTEARYVLAKKSLIDTATAPDALLNNTPLPNLPVAPVKPVPLKINVSDITSQKLVRHAADRPRGLLCYLDEMASWVGKVCDPRSGDDRSAWTVAYEGRRYEMDRVGSGTTTADNYALAFFGNLQPRVLKENFKALSKDGLVQRFIPVTLRPGQTRLGNPVPDYMTNAAEYDQMVRVCFGLPPMTYRLSGPAHDTYRGFQHWYNSMMFDERLLQGSGTLQTAMGKLEGLVGRIALVWHCIESPYSLEVSDSLMQRVVGFVRQYVLPSMRYAFEGTSGMGLEKWCGEYVMQYADMPSINLNQIRRGARRQIEGMSIRIAEQHIIVAMQALEDAKWVARVDDGSEEHKGVAQWAINPGLRTRFADYRSRVIEAKQRRRDELHAGPKTDRTRVYGYEGDRQRVA